MFKAKHRKHGNLENLENFGNQKITEKNFMDLQLLELVLKNQEI